MLDYPPGWTCKRTVLRFEHYLLGTLVLEEALAVAEHLEACDRCPQHLVLFRLTLVQRSRG
jgi:anti-sigma factor RsiW